VHRISLHPMHELLLVCSDCFPSLEPFGALARSRSWRRVSSLLGGCWAMNHEGNRDRCRRSRGGRLAGCYLAFRPRLRRWVVSGSALFLSSKLVLTCVGAGHTW